MSTLDIGLIGVGSMGRYVADLVQKKSNEVHLSSLYDPNEDSVAKTREYVGFDGRVCDSVEDLLAGKSDWVMIASWNAFHAEQSIAAFRAGKNVFCQKPLATTLDECLAMRDAWRQSGKQFVIGFTLRYSPHYRRLSQLVLSGAIGDIVSMDFNETLGFNHGGYIMGDWRRLKANAGSHVLEKCCHDIDIANWLIGARARRVASFGGTDFFTPENERHIERLGVDEKGRDAYRVRRGTIGENPFTGDKDIVDNQVVILEYENNVRASFHMNSNSGIPERRMYLCGTEGTIRSDVITGRIELQRIGFDTQIEDCSSEVAGMHGGGDDVLASELVSAMLQGTPMSAGIEEGLNAAVTCFAIDEAMDSGQVVDMAPWWERVDRA
ncbi:MAG TPA: Gfo/Idh/MocA family oxidoreductase [Pseudomonadales bacterium]|nr:Gfo/Idh/MocA family oxidoreductase [Pseudomonadales bacterium]